MPKCPMCGQWFDAIEIPKDVWDSNEWCPKCITDWWNRDAVQNNEGEQEEND